MKDLYGGFVRLRLSLTGGLKMAIALPAIMILIQLVSNANVYDFSKFAKQRELLTYNGFIENKGQIFDEEGNANNDVKFLYKNKSFKCALKSNGFSYELTHLEYKETETELAKYKGLPEFVRNKPEFNYNTHRVDIDFLNCNQLATFEKFGGSEGFFNYYLGHTGNDGVVDVRWYERIVYKNIYPNIDIEFFVTETGIKYDVIVKPEGNVSEVRMKFSGQNNIMPIDEHVIKILTSEGFVEERMGQVYSVETVTDRSEQSSVGNKSFINARFRLNGDILGFETDDYDRSKTLVIDPEIVWGTYFGDIHREGINAVCTDELNNVIATGYTESTANIATSGAYQTSYGGGSSDAFLVKFDYSGKRLWSTYFGGENVDVGQGVAADNVWHYVFIMGYTSSTTGIASTGAYQEDYASGYFDAFIAKFDLIGGRQWSTYYGGSGVVTTNGGDIIYAAAIDERFNDIYFTGVTTSGDAIASEGAHQTDFGGGFDAMLVKFNTDGDREWGTYIGGEGFDGAYGITLDPSGYITIGGYTDSDNSYWWGDELIASEGAYKESRTGNSDAFLARFNLRGTRQWGTYYGGTDQEIVKCLSADKDKNIYIGGETMSSDGISTSGSHQPVKDTGSTGFIGKFSSTGSRLWGTYYGGDREDVVIGMYCNSTGELKVIGYTTSENAIATPGSFGDTFVGRVIMGENPEPPPDSVIVGYHYDGFVASFEGTGARQWGSYFGGGDQDQPLGIAIDMNENMIIGGTTASTYYIGTPGTYRSTYFDTTDGFIMKIGDFVKISNLSTPFCVGNTINVSFETGREMNTGNVFTAQLSDSTGDFTNAVDIGTKSGTTDGVITATIPVNTIPASGYRIRVKCSNPSKIGSDNGYDITIYGLPQPLLIGDTTVCSRGAEVYECSTDSGLYENRWYISNGTFIGDSTLETCTVRWLDVSGGTIKVVQQNTETNCVDSVTKVIKIDITPAPNITGEADVVINTTETYRTTSQSFLNYNWEVTGGSITNDNTNSEIEVLWGGTGTGYLKLVVTHKTTGCSDSLTLTVAINAVPIDINGKKTVCAYSNEQYSISGEQNVTYKWVIIGGVVQGNDSDTLANISWGPAGTGVIQIIRTNTQTQLIDTAVRNIKILDVPDVKILGINEICGNDEVLYIAVNKVGVASQWSVYNGTIMGESNKDSVIVQWNDVPDGEDSVFVKGTLYLTQTSIETGCPFTQDLKVSISDNPDAIVLGRFGVCQRDIEIYKTVVPNPQYSNYWRVERGTILSSPTDTLIQVEWGLEGTGKLILVQTASTNCIDSNVIEIDINSQPARPAISQQGLALVSSAETGNQWFTNDQPIPGADAKQYTPADSGYYSVQVTDENGCVSQMSIPYLYVVTISVNDGSVNDGYVFDADESNRYFNVYPNPAQDVLKIIFEQAHAGSLNLKLRNMLSVVLFEQQLLGIDSNHEHNIDLKTLPAGMYTIELQIGQNVYVKKFIKY